MNARQSLLCGALLLTAASLMFTNCKKESNGSPEPEPIASQISRTAWYDTYPPDISGAKTSVSSEAVKLEFYGWGEDKDHTFTLDFPADHRKYKRAIITYRMGAWNQGPSSYDNTTMVFVKNKADGQWYEITRAFTPFGNSFGASWERFYYFDVTDFLPMLEGTTEFRVYYGGFDATATRAHTATLTFDLYEGTPERNTVWTAKVYDTSRDGNSGYRAWSYGCEGYDIEAPERLGQREFTIPAAVKTLELRVAVSGHGHDLGDFPDRAGYQKNNAAEFVSNTYAVKVNGQEAQDKGKIWTLCGKNYAQAGTCYYDRANWCPGNPLMTQYWRIKVPDGGGKITLDLDLERFVSQKNDIKAEGVAQYIIEADLFGFDR